MKITTYNEPQPFLDECQEELERQEVTNSLILGVVMRMISPGLTSLQGDPYMGAARGDSGLSAAAMITPPFGVALAIGENWPEAGVELIAEDLHQKGWSLPTVLGPKPYAEQFAISWAEKTGGSYELKMAERVFKLEEVSPPTAVSGAMRLATREDFDLIVRWRAAFAAEALGEDEPNQDLEVIKKYSSQQIEAGGFYLWEDGGKPVSMTLRTRPTRRGCTVTAVYTPPESRRQGYASALVAGVSQTLLDEGYDFTTLFTDLANPTSNKIYQQIGYQPVCDFDQFKFEE